MKSEPQPAFGRWDWLGPIYVALQLAVMLFLHHRSRRREGRSPWSPFMTRADLISSLKADFAIALMNTFTARFVPQVPTGRKGSAQLERRRSRRHE